MAYNKLKALLANIEAIETAMSVRSENRRPTAEEKEKLLLYSGFGGIKDVLNLGTDNPVPDEMSEPLHRLQTLITGYPGFADDTMRRNAIDGLKASVLTAFYTPGFIIDAISTEVQSLFMRQDIEMGSFLEPSAGIGGFLPVAAAETEAYAFEKDPLTGLVLACLYEGENVSVTVNGFETIGEQCLIHDRFDVIASNIPFGNFSVFDADLWKRGGIYDKATKTIHNYFFVKSMELLNEGGLLIFITSRGVADAPGNKFVREYLVGHADLITALRLPDRLFMQTGGIEVGSDLLIFQKHTGKVSQSHREKLFVQHVREDIGNGEKADPMNRLFTQPTTALATGSAIGTNQFGRPVRKYRWDNGDTAMKKYLMAILRADFDRYFKKYLFSDGISNARSSLSLFGDDDMAATPSERGRRGYTGTLRDWMKEGTLVMFEGQLGTLKIRKSKHYSDAAVDFDPIAPGALNIDRANDYLPMREAYFNLFLKEREEMTEQPELREQLNSLYDSFIAKWGHFHDNDNRDFFMLDALGTEVFTIETQDGTEITKSDIMREAVAFKRLETDVVLTPAEAFSSSLNFFGRVNMDYICGATRRDIEDIISSLRGEIFYNPLSRSWEDKGTFIAGNVIAKLRQVHDCIELMDRENSGDAQYRAYALTSAKALEEAVPEQVPYEELDINMGERWIDTGIYAMFATELFGTETQVMYFDVNDTYVVSLRGYSPVAYNTYSVRNYNGEELFVHALHDTVPEITKEIYVDGEKKRVPDEEAIQEAGTKIQEIRALFNEWLDRQPLFVRDGLVTAYNERFNCYVRPSYDGSGQTFPGLSFNQFGYDSLYPSQKDAVRMIKQNGGGICWHAVGTGKTMIMCVAAYEMKRLGLCNKPMIIGLKANVHEIADTFLKAYPSARVLYPGKEDFTPANRREVFAKIMNNNWDCIILTHDQFVKIPQSEETMIDIFSEELADVERCLEVLEQSTMRYRSGRMQKGLETRRQNLTTKLARLRELIEERRDDTVDFRSMGIDHLFVDECQIAKNLMFQTRHTRVAGIGNTTGSQRALNILFAIRDIQKRTGRDLGATFLSGTVVVNALTELYVMFKYLRPKELKRQRISCFDAWAAIYTKKCADYELNVTGSIRRKERFRSYIKVPELAMFLREITDYRTAEMINLDIPDKNVRFITISPTPEQEEMIGRLVDFASSGEWGDLGLSTPAPENLDKAKMLVATNVARKMSLDMRLLGDEFSDDPGNKAAVCARTVYEYYTRFNAERGTQFIFSDLSTYRPDRWNIYSDIKEKLVTLGIPADEIQFVQTATTERARKKLFADMNSGRVRVLFGSTTMLGTGVNAQERAVAIHHLEVPWRPADMEQRDGRAVRKGNTVKLWGGNVVDVVVYGTEKTLDAYKFNLLRNKQMFINQINNGTIGVRRIDEDGMDEDNGMNFAEFVALLSGNSDLLEKAKLDSRIMQLEKERAIFKKEHVRAERAIASNDEAIIRNKEIIDRLERDLDYVSGYQGEAYITMPDCDAVTTEEIGRELQRIARENRSQAFVSIGSYMGLSLLVKADCGSFGEFDHNSFYVEGLSGLKYRHGQTGALPLAFVDKVQYPKMTLQRLPSIIEGKRKEIQRLEGEQPVLREIIGRSWSKADELARLKAECDALQNKIDEDLKKAEQAHSGHGDITGPVEDAA